MTVDTYVAIINRVTELVIASKDEYKESCMQLYDEINKILLKEEIKSILKQEVQE